MTPERPSRQARALVPSGRDDGSIVQFAPPPKSTTIEHEFERLRQSRARMHMRNSTKAALALFTVLVALAAMAGHFLLENYKVVAKGQILPYTEGYIYEILIAGKLRIYVEPEMRMRLDVFNAFILAGVSYIALTFAAIRFHHHRDALGSLFWFYALLSVGTLFLAADELLGIHESLGHNLPSLAALPGIKRPDDFIVFLYGVGAIVFIFSFRRVLLEARRSWWLFLVSMLLVAIAGVSDVIGLESEEVAEVLAGLFMIAGTLSLGVTTLARSHPGGAPGATDPRG